MGMGTAGAHSWVISDEKLKELLPIEYAALEKVLADHPEGWTVDALAEAFNMEVVIDSEILTAYDTLLAAFNRATTIYRDAYDTNADLFPIGSLKLSLCPYDSEGGDIYDDELDGNHYWDVEGMTRLTPAGQAFSSIVQEKSWTEYG